MSAGNIQRDPGPELQDAPANHGDPHESLPCTMLIRAKLAPRKEDVAANRN
ncbi:predicted protein [Uncinocarpus reesii 1704]|uniref:Uncharacterized protein n=1 Tax=Uncinocarpus reesii (strain UAMH 1704) TaxID=336963 RepID=C4JNM7_UNCRE|nr:uncharacterized protein UREG_03025 [Uncinocarpus reesii 1704]EEP78180.1 predicted protein [Uncinocarpus reesii 1704]